MTTAARSPAVSKRSDGGVKFAAGRLARNLLSVTRPFFHFSDVRLQWA